MFHALSDETRLQILDRLEGGEHCVCELMDLLKSAQSRLSFHLKVLKQAGLIEDRREGRWMYYSLKKETFEELEELILTLKKCASSSYVSKRCT